MVESVMPKGHLFIDMTGQSVGDWTVTSRSPKTNAAGHVFWEVRCVCGIERAVPGAQLRNGHSTGCGCTADKRKAEANTTHGLAWKHPLYGRWAGMRDRCSNPNHKLWHRYGGRGIKVCERWDSFENFLADMGEPPAGYTLDRINNDGDYEPGNCRWASYAEQHRNKSTNHNLTFRGETATLADWAERHGLTTSCVRYRILKMGWDVERALTTPLMRRKTPR